MAEDADSTADFDSAGDLMCSKGGAAEAQTGFFSTKGTEEELFLLPGSHDGIEGFRACSPAAMQSSCSLGTGGTGSLVGT